VNKPYEELTKRAEVGGRRGRRKVFHSINEVKRTYFPKAYAEEQAKKELIKRQTERVVY
jgi:hypothetical protein